jgi:hypothetical protein
MSREPYMSTALSRRMRTLSPSLCRQSGAGSHFVALFGSIPTQASSLRPSSSLLVDSLVTLRRRAALLLSYQSSFPCDPLEAQK